MNAIQEVYRITRAQTLIALCSTVPGYWFTVFLIDRIGRFTVQLLGFVMMTIFMFVLAFPYNYWTHPENNIKLLVITMKADKLITERILALGLCKEERTAIRTAKAIMVLGFYEETEVPLSCKSAFDVTCLRMEERLAYTPTEQDMVLLHHEAVVEFPNGCPTETHEATLLEFGRNQNGKVISGMALTVGIPVAIGALLLLAEKITTTGVLRPIDAEVYESGLFQFLLGETMEQTSWKIITPTTTSQDNDEKEICGFYGVCSVILFCIHVAI